MSLFTVSFTTQSLVKTYGPKGKIISETRLDKPVVLTALPYATAMSYSKCDAFSITPYVMDERRASYGSGRDASVGNGTKRAVSRSYEAKPGASVSKTAAKNSGVSKIENAAATGNLAAALNI